MEIFLELAKSWGAPGVLALILWWQLEKGEKREATLGTRVQLLENKIMENYDERISAADQITTALLSSAHNAKELTDAVHKVLEALSNMRRTR